MKATEHFKKQISDQLEIMANADPLFADCLAKPEKNIDDCITYILNYVQKSGCNAFTEEEIFGLAAHYYDEDGIEIGNKIDCNVIVKRTPELTAEEIREAKQKAIDQVVEEERKRMTVRKPVTKKEEAVEAPTLF